MKKTCKFAFAMVTLAALFAVVVPIQANTLIKDEFTIDTGGIFDVKGTLKINAVTVTSSAAELNTMNGVTATTEEINTVADASALNNATDTNSVMAIVETIQPIQKLTGTFSAVTVTATDTSDEGESIKLCDFPAGLITVISSLVNASSVTSAGATNTYVCSIGTAAAGDDSALTGTEADLIPSTSIDTTGGTVMTNAFDAVLGAPATFDGTATAIVAYYNFAIDDDNMDADVTNTVTGTWEILYVDGGDNQ